MNEQLTNYLISIIIPVYNSEKYLDRTIKSLQSQSYPNFEVIFIDDGSSDKSKDILANFKKEDSRIQVLVNLENQGPFLSRRIGLKNIHGNFFMFCDADDELAPRALETYLQTSLHYAADIIACSVQRHERHSTPVWGKLGNDAVQFGQKEIRQELFQENIPWTLANKFYHSNLLKKQLPYNLPQKLFQDEDWLQNVLLVWNALGMVQIPDVLYHYHIRQDSNYFDPSIKKFAEKIDNYIFTLNWVRDFLQDAPKKYQTLLERRGVILFQLLLPYFSDKEFLYKPDVQIAISQLVTAGHLNDLLEAFSRKIRTLERKFWYKFSKLDKVNKFWVLIKKLLS